MDQKNSSFLDPSTIVAILMVGIAWFFWQSYMNKKYSHLYSSQKKVLQESEMVHSDLKDENLTQNINNNIQQPERQEQKETTLTYSDDIWTVTFSSQGMGIKSLYLNKYKDKKGQPIHLIKQEDVEMPLTFSTYLINQKEIPYFKLSQKENYIYGIASVGGIRITKTVVIDSQNYSFKTSVQAEKIEGNFIGLITKVTGKIDKPEKNSSFFVPSFDRQEFYIHSLPVQKRIFIEEDKILTESPFSQVKIVALGMQYFTQAILDKSQVAPTLNLKTMNQTVQGDLHYEMLNKDDIFNLEYVFFAGPKKHDILSRIDKQMIHIIDFGWFSFIAKYLLFLMGYFYSIVGNWGLTIIILTIIVRFLVLPFNIISYKSMRTMSRIQPYIKQIQEKYKEDPQTKNKKIMELMKEYKANPFMGCLPMLLQIPIFFALYRVLASSIELYRAPFLFWIQDLSLKDPYYILPVLMGATFFIQQKITPSTMDSTQKKVMMSMPILFTLFTLGLPSGLTLYIFTSSLFGLLQQLWFTKYKQSEEMAKS